jgi:hypothetical protein
MAAARAALLLALLAAAAGCGRPAPPTPAGPAIERVDFTAFGSPVTLQVAGADPDRTAGAVADIRAFLAVAGRDWYAFGDGELARVNAALAAGEPAPVSPELAAVIARALDIAGRSGGRFDPAVGDLVTLWGYAGTAAAGRGRRGPGRVRHGRRRDAGRRRGPRPPAGAARPRRHRQGHGGGADRRTPGGCGHRRGPGRPRRQQPAGPRDPR